METTDLLKKVRKLEIKTRRLSDHLFSGEYHSSFKGKGMTFSEVRQYQVGDDIRNIEWNVTARKNEPYIKVFEEERELTMMLLIDVSASGIFGSQSQRKSDIITEMSATLAFSAKQNNDKIGVIFFSDKIEKFIPPSKGKTHVLRIIRELIEFTPESKGTNISMALEYLSSVVRKKSIVFLLSDFRDENYDKALKIASKRHDLTGVRLWDPVEKEFPKLGLIPLLDPETNSEKWVWTSSKSWRKKHKEKFLREEAKFVQLFTKAGAGRVSISTKESYVSALYKYFKQKGR